MESEYIIICILQSLLQTPKTIPQLVEEVARKLNVPEDKVAKSVNNCLDSLVDMGVLATSKKSEGKNLNGGDLQQAEEKENDEDEEDNAGQGVTFQNYYRESPCLSNKWVPTIIVNSNGEEFDLDADFDGEEGGEDDEAEDDEDEDVEVEEEDINNETSDESEMESSECSSCYDEDDNSSTDSSNLSICSSDSEVSFGDDSNSESGESSAADSSSWRTDSTEHSTTDLDSEEDFIETEDKE